MDWPSLLKRRIRSGYVISFLLLLFSVCLIFYVQQKLARESDRLMHSYVILNKAESLKAEVTAAETGMRGYLITRDSHFLKPYTFALAKVPALCTQLKNLMTRYDGRQNPIDTLEQFIKKRMDILSTGLINFQVNGMVFTDEMESRLNSGMNTMDSVRLYISNLQGAEERSMQERKKRLSVFFVGAKIMAIVILVVVLIALIYSLTSFNREYRAREKADEIANKYRVDLESNKTELQEKNLELKELKDLEKFTSTGRIARTIAHEVRNPLTNILLATEQLKETEGDNEDSLVLLDLINRNAGRINELVSDLLNATRFSHLDFEKTDINVLMEETLGLAKDRLDLNQIYVEKNFSSSAGNISVDKEKMKVAFLNIIVNAIEAMEKGKGILHLTTKKLDNKCIVEIRDNGRGMDEESLQKLFEPYFTTKLKGNGLGLTNTQNIILNHNGTIRAYSKHEEGSCFIITLDLLTASTEQEL